MKGIFSTNILLFLRDAFDTVQIFVGAKKELAVTNGGASIEVGFVGGELVMS